MFPSSFSPNRLAACSALSNWNEVGLIDRHGDGMGRAVAAPAGVQGERLGVLAGHGGCSSGFSGSQFRAGSGAVKHVPSEQERFPRTGPALERNARAPRPSEKAMLRFVSVACATGRMLPAGRFRSPGRLLFSSLIFIFGFLPVALCGFFLIGRLGRPAAAVWLVGVSLVFYGWWNPPAVFLLLGSIGTNYAIATLILVSEQHPIRQTIVTLTGVAFNLLALVYYKYLFAIAGFLHGLAPSVPAIDPIVLPPGHFLLHLYPDRLSDRLQGRP